MTYTRMIEGKYGPYKYKSVREGKNVKSIYLGPAGGEGGERSETPPKESYTTPQKTEINQSKMDARLKTIIRKIEVDAKEKHMLNQEDFLQFVMGGCMHREFRPDIGIQKEDIPSIAEWAKKKVKTL